MLVLFEDKKINREIKKQLRKNNDCVIIIDFITKKVNFIFKNMTTYILNIVTSSYNLKKIVLENIEKGENIINMLLNDGIVTIKAYPNNLKLNDDLFLDTVIFKTLDNQCFEYSKVCCNSSKCIYK